MIDFSSLNVNQKAAVDWSDGPLLVLAGPGSGKTRVLTYRISKLLQESEGSRFKILALTFTKKAAAEMRDRVEQLIPGEINRTLLTTFHSFCAEVLRQHGSHVGLNPNFTILTDNSDREAIIKDIINSENNGILALEDIKYLKTIDILISNFIPINKVKEQFGDESIGEKIEYLYSTYQSHLIESNFVDYNTLLYFTDNLFSNNRIIKKQYQLTYKYICVDEYQDTNLAQYKILTHLINNKTKNLFVVADDDQIIYQWNGANPQRLYDLQENYEMEVVQLPENYRCPQSVVSIANKLIKHNILRSEDKIPLKANKEGDNIDCIRLFSFNTQEDEFEWIASDIKEKFNENLDSCTILARNRYILEGIYKTLQDNSIPVYMVQRKNDYESAPIVFLYNFLKLYNNRHDNSALRKLCKSFYQVEGKILSYNEILKFAPLHEEDLLKTFLDRAISINGLAEVTIKLLTELQIQVEKMIIKTNSVSTIFSWLDALQTSYLSDENEFFTDYDSEKETWNEIQTQVLSQHGIENFSIHLLLQEMDLAPKTPPIPANSVTCYTIHNSKGLEFHHVYIAGMAEDTLPSFQAVKKGNESLEMQEERRNCFVAITRTQETLTLTYATQYRGWQKRPSRFLFEMELLS